MQRTMAGSLPTLEPGSPVTIQGWLHRRRTLASVTFLIVRDRTGLAQVVVKDPETVRQTQEYGEETVLEIAATAVANPAAPGGVELVDPRITMLSAPAETPPVELWRPSLTAGLPTLLDNAPVTLRHPRSRAV